MTTEELEQNLKNRGVPCRVQKAEVIVEECFYCGNDRWNLELNAEVGVYHCWACDEGGRLDRLLESQFGIRSHIPIHAWRDSRREVEDVRRLDLEIINAKSAYLVASVKRYLTNRGIDEPDAEKYKIQVVLWKDGGTPLEGRILFPLSEYWSQAPMGLMCRRYLNNLVPKYLIHQEPPVRMIVGYRNRYSKVHVIVEGVIDGIHVHRAGFNAAVLLGSTAKDVEAWAARVPKGHDVIVLLDGDVTQAAFNLYWRIKPIYDRVQVITLPPHLDPGDLESGVIRELLRSILHEEE